MVYKMEKPADIIRPEVSLTSLLTNFTEKHAVKFLGCQPVTRTNILSEEIKTQNSHWDISL